MLTETIRQGAQRLLSVAIEAEVQRFIDVHSDVKDTEGRRLVVRNGYLPERPLYIESFNGSFRDECLNAHRFLSLKDAREKIETWRKDYNEF